MPTINTMRAGDRLDNGAIVIEITRHPRNGRTYVLAITPADMSDDPYASWEITDRGVTINGYYSANLAQAVAEYHERAGVV